MKKNNMTPRAALSARQLSQNPKLVSADTSDVLIGFRGCDVLVENLDEDAVATGLRKDQITTAVELTLRRNGVRIVSEQEAFKLPGSPYFYITLQVMNNAFRYDAYLKEMVTPHRRPSTSLIGVPVWRKGGLGTHGGDPDYIVKAILSLVDAFCNDYLKANPK